MFVIITRYVCRHNTLRLRTPLKESFGDGIDATSDAASEGETLLEDFGCEQGAMVLRVISKDLLQDVCRFGVEDEGIHFIVETE